MSLTDSTPQLEGLFLRKEAIAGRVVWLKQSAGWRFGRLSWSKRAHLRSLTTNSGKSNAPFILLFIWKKSRYHTDWNPQTCKRLLFRMFQLLWRRNKTWNFFMNEYWIYKFLWWIFEPQDDKGRCLSSRKQSQTPDPCRYLSKLCPTNPVGHC